MNCPNCKEETDAERIDRCECGYLQVTPIQPKDEKKECCEYIKGNWRNSTIDGQVVEICINCLERERHKPAEAKCECGRAYWQAHNPTCPGINEVPNNDSDKEVEVTGFSFGSHGDRHHLDEIDLEALRLALARRQK